jgi:hypothetical protein
VTAVEGEPLTRAAQVTQAQYDYLRQGINSDRIRQMQGMSHIEAWDVRRTLIRIFGFGGYDIEDRGITLVKEIETPPDHPKGKTRWTVVYLAKVRLIIKDAHGREIAHFDDSATGDAINMPSIGDAHDFAVKTASSQALKRCAVNMGDQFGLSLYNKGCTGGVVVKSLVSPHDDGPAPTPEDAPAVLGGEMDDDQTPPEHRAQPAMSGPPRKAAQRPAPSVPPVPPVALKTAAQAAACDDAMALRGVRKWVREKGMESADIRSAVDASATVLNLPTGPLTLAGWLDECIARVEVEGLSVDDQIRVIKEEGVPA